MIRRDPPANQPLDAEERALADALRRGLSHPEPTPDLDARIVAMAGAAAAPPALAAPAGNTIVKPHRTRRFASWPAFASAAAVAVLAVGLGWRLWPAHMQRNGDKEMSAADQSAAVAATQAMDHQGLTAMSGPSAAETDAAAIAVTADPAPAAASAPPPRIVEHRQAAAVALPPPVAEMPVDAAAAAEPAMKAPAPPSSNDTASPMARSADSAVSALPAPAAPPPPPSAPPAPAAASRQALENITVTGSRIGPVTGSQPVEVERARAADHARPAAMQTTAVPAATSEAAKVAAPRPANEADAASAVSTENGYDARPPVTVQDSGVRDAWLKRIRELMTHGDRDAARASLLELRSRYPEVVIPADLQPLLAPVK